MKAEFFLKHVPQRRDVPAGDVEFVRISGHHGKDEVERPATDADRGKFKAEYAAFKSPDPGPVAAVAESDAPPEIPEQKPAKKPRKPKAKPVDEER